MSLSKSEVFGDIPHLAISFDQKLSTEDTNYVLSKLARIHHLDKLSEAGWSAAGLHIADSLTSGDFHNLCYYDPDVLDLGPADQAHIRQCLAFFSKRVDIDIGVDREAAARSKFWCAEESCRAINSKFRRWSQGSFVFSPLVERVLHTSARKISKLLGPAPKLADLRIRFGPGATTQTLKQNACPVVKLGSTPAVSMNAEHLLDLPEIQATMPYLGLMSLDGYVDFPIHTSRLSFVPKNAKIDRAICTEPAFNGMFQNGLGSLIAGRLRAIGIDIRDQSANQRAAMYGSISNASATVDLSMASDTISLGLVEHLLPEEWFSLISCLRTADMLDQGKYHRLQKVSSMGNGFTFPLETLIFWALTQSCVDYAAPKTRVRTLVYGDDIVCDVSAVDSLFTVFEELGFVPNPSKSFYDGTFRESCGKDYVLGTNIRPLYVSDALTGADFFRIHNHYVRNRNFVAARWVEQWIHPSIRCRGPDGYGDGHLISATYVSRRSGAKYGQDGYTFETWGFSPKHLKGSLLRQLLPPPKGGWKSKGAEDRALRGDGGKLTYKSTAHVIIRTLAIYTQYLRSEDAEGQLYRDRRVFDHKFVGPLAKLSARDIENIPTQTRHDIDHLVVPGKGQLRRMKVYTFESPKFIT